MHRPLRPSKPAKKFPNDRRQVISTTPRLLQSREEDRGFQDVVDQKLSSGETSKDQLAAIQELEKVLGKPIEAAIKDDQLAASSASHSFENQIHITDEATQVEAADDPVAAARDSGANAEEVAREARQIFGEALPDGVLEDHETKVYKRLYGEPDPELEEDIGYEDGESAEMGNELLDHQGAPVDYEPIKAAEERIEESQQSIWEPEEELVLLDSASGGQLDFSDTYRSRIRSITESLEGDVLEEQNADLDADDDEEPHQREHPLTQLGKFATKPGTVNMPREGYLQPFQSLMSNYSNKHLKEVCERTFGGGGLPDSPLTPRSGKIRPQVAVSLEASQFAMSEMEANAFMTAIMPAAHAAITSVLIETRKRLGPTWLNELLAKEGGPRVLDAGAGGAGILAWNEIVNAHWRTLHTSDKDPPPPPPSKAVVLTGSDALRHRSANLLANTTFIPRLPDYTRTRDSPTLQDDRPAQQRKQFDIVIAPYTLLSLKEDWEKKLYVQNLWSLVDSSGGILVVIEKGIPRGFEAIAGARELLLERHISSPLSHSTDYNSDPEGDSDAHAKSTGMIVAPCTNHAKCPLYKVPGKSQGRKDLCSFQQRYTRPPHLQRVLGAKDRNYDDVDFSYISVMKGRDLRQHEISTFEHMIDPLSAPVHRDSNNSPSPAPTELWLETCQDGFFSATPTSNPSKSSSTPIYPPPQLLPRLIFPPIKRRGHILLDLCTPLGTIERWTVPRSFSKQAYRDARKSQWGDLWGLGAKTRVARSLKVGVGSKEVREMMKRLPGGGGGRGIGVGGEVKEVWVGKGRSREERLKNQAVKLIQRMEEEKAGEKEEKKQIERDLADEFDVPVSEVKSAMRASEAGKETKAGAIKAQTAKLDEADHYVDPDEDAAWSEWQAEYAADSSRSPGINRKRGSAFRTQGVSKSSKAAKRMQKEQFAGALADRSRP